MTECVGRGRRAAGRAQGMAGEVVASSWRVRLLHTRRGWAERECCRLPRPGTCGGISTALAPAAASVLLLPHGRNHRRAGDLARAARVWGAAPVGCRTLARSRARGRTSVLGHAEAIAGAGAGQDAGARAARHGHVTHGARSQRPRRVHMCCNQGDDELLSFPPSPLAWWRCHTNGGPATACRGRQPEPLEGTYRCVYAPLADTTNDKPTRPSRRAARQPTAARPSAPGPRRPTQAARASPPRILSASPAAPNTHWHIRRRLSPPL
jgi:hypothetical protein